MWYQIGLVVLGLTVLTVGADWLVRGASRIALALGISPLIVGLTVVAFGTSSPEMAVSVTSAYAGSNEIAVANVVGSNIFNVLFILGLSALAAPLVVHQQLVRMDVPIMLGASLLLYALAFDGLLGIWDSALLAALIVGYTVFLIADARRERNAAVIAEYSSGVQQASGGAARPVVADVGLVVVGLVMLVAGSKAFVTGAIEVARMLEVSEVVIGLTIVAAGTSLPELATSVVAALRGERDIAIGNVIGSNIFNILAVLGFAGLASAGQLAVAPTLLSVDIPVMTGVALLCLPLFRAGYILSRLNGATFLVIYAVYVLFLVWQQQDHPGLGTLRVLVFNFLCPVLIISTVLYTVISLKSEANNPP